MADCIKCGEPRPLPGLWEAIIGNMACPECETVYEIPLMERREIAENIDQELHVLRQQIDHLMPKRNAID